MNSNLKVPNWSLKTGHPSLGFQTGILETGVFRVSFHQAICAIRPGRASHAENLRHPVFLSGPASLRRVVISPPKARMPSPVSALTQLRASGAIFSAAANSLF